MTGTIKTLVTDKGFGFIRGQNGMEYFFHRSAVQPAKSYFDSLRVGDTVSFEVTTSDRGPRAEQVRPL